MSDSGGWSAADAVARVVTEGVVGARLVEIVPGRPDAPALSASGAIAAEPPIEVADLLRDASASLRRIDAVAQAAERSLDEIQQIAAAIRKGEGSLGKLVQDDEAYRKLVALSDRGEHTLNDLEDNLAALKRTWPLSRYFNGRAFFDRDRVLFHPGAERDSRTLREDDLFEPGRSVLTAAGRQRPQRGRRLVQEGPPARRPRSSSRPSPTTPRDAELAQVLTQEQADAVRKYLVAQHQIDSAGWFATRKIAAVGFGNEIPQTLDTATDPNARPKTPTPPPPPRRVEIILFTPQA